ncbi:MAG: hypothetical protein M3Y39_01295 [Chloroflexota bacterium]|nr:hypothetical protein [Chloroflexota bacterium]
MRGRLKVSALLTFVLAILFYLFFQISKHQPALSQVNAFADDPYDSIGSFGVQFALFTALLSLLRAFRPYRAGRVLDSQEQLLLRGAYLSCLSVAVTLAADIVAMIRHPTIWIGQTAGYVLATLIVGMALFTALVTWQLHYATQNRRSLFAPNVWIRAIGSSLISLLILAFYPESWRQSVPGELLTILVGTALLFVPLWAVGTAIPSSSGAFVEDFIDDLIATYRWLKAHIGPLVVFCNFFEKILNWSFVHAVLDWLNPRKHIWNLIILIGIIMGMVLALAETLGEGGGPHEIGRFTMIVAIFISLECIAVLLGYVLLAKPLGLFRKASDAVA